MISDALFYFANLLFKLFNYAPGRMWKTMPSESRANLDAGGPGTTGPPGMEGGIFLPLCLGCRL